MNRCALIAFEGCALWQVVFVQAALAQSGWTVHTLTLEGSHIRTMEGLRLLPDHAVEDAAPWDYKLLLLPGGDIRPELAEEPRLKRFLRQYDGGERRIAAMGSSSAILAAAGLLGGLRVSVPQNLNDELAKYFQYTVPVAEEICESGNIITCRGSAEPEFVNTLLHRSGVSMESALKRLDLN